MRNDKQNNHLKQNGNSFFAKYLDQARLNAYIAFCRIFDLPGENTVEENRFAVMPVLPFLAYKKDAVMSKRAELKVQNATRNSMPVLFISNVSM